MKHGETVSAFERELAAYCGAKYAIAASNGTVTLQAALVALGVTPGDRVAVPPLTMSATTIAVLNVGAVPVFVDVDPATWLMDASDTPTDHAIGVSLYGLHYCGLFNPFARTKLIDDAAQTLRQHDRGFKFTSLSFQASKILSTGEGGALLTNDEALAERARSYLSLGYRMSATQARIDSAAIKSPTFDRHVMYPAINGRMNDVTAELGRRRLSYYSDDGEVKVVDHAKTIRGLCADQYRKAHVGCAWLTPQRVSPGMVHDYWCYAVACDTPERAVWLSDAMVRHGGERPYPAWRLTYDEPAFQHLNPPKRTGWVAFHLTDKPGPIETTHETARPHPCPVAESLQPRLLQFQTNDLASAERNARALARAIQEAA
jgi:perosamine synthetase